MASSRTSMARLLEASPCACGGRSIGAERRAAIVGGERLRLLKLGTVEAVLLRVLQVPPCWSPTSGAAVDLQAVAPAASPPTSPMSCQPPPSTPSLAMAGARARKG